jgi:hypothetical protein
MMDNAKNDHGWSSTSLKTIPEILEKLASFSMHNNKWLFRGQPKNYNRLILSIDRGDFEKITERINKLSLERQSIELFRSTVKLIADEAERKAIENKITTLMLLQHYGAPTRLLDWSFSPYIATYFAVCSCDEDNGELWGFDYDQYEENGGKQWVKNPETMKNGKFDDQLTTAFTKDYFKDWFVCQFYYKSFPRLIAQNGAFTMTSQFGRDHAKSIKDLINNSNCHHLYIIDGNCKLKLRQILKEKLNIWHGMLYPDSTGAAEGVMEILLDEVRRDTFSTENV